MATKHFTLLRHGRVKGAAALYGHTDVALSEQGYHDLCKAIQHVHTQLPIDSIISSPLIRCATIAHTFSAQHNIHLQLNPHLKEMHFGVWDGVAFDDLGSSWKQLESFWNAPFSVSPPEGETLVLFAERVINAWELIMQNNVGQHQLIVCHGGVIRIILTHLLQIDWRNACLFKQLHIEYASTTRIELGDYEGALPQVKWIGRY